MPTIVVPDATIDTINSAAIKLDGTTEACGIIRAIAVAVLGHLAQVP